MDEENSELITRIQRQLILDTKHSPPNISNAVDKCLEKMDSLHLSHQGLKRASSAPNLLPNSNRPSAQPDLINHTLSFNFQRKCDVSNSNSNDNPYLYNIDLPNR
jgi:hypothetical protein